jgi:hypothetical protein
MMRVVCMVALLLLGSTESAASDTTWKSKRGLFVVTYASDLDPLEINKLHGWTLQLASKDGEAVTAAVISVDGGMPKHDHGLATQPRVTQELGDGAYRLDGLRFHMRGDWEVTLTIEANGVTDAVTIKLIL